MMLCSRSKQRQDIYRPSSCAPHHGAHRPPPPSACPPSSITSSCQRASAFLITSSVKLHSSLPSSGLYASRWTHRFSCRAL